MYLFYDIKMCSKMTVDETIEIAYIVIEKQRCFSVSIIMLYE